MTIEKGFDIPPVASLALKEMQFGEIYRPTIAVGKWFARRSGTLFRAPSLLDFFDERLDGTYFDGHDFAGKRVAEQAPDFIVPDEFSAAVVNEAKLTEVEGTARDEVTRVLRLSTLRDERRQHYDFAVYIAGRGLIKVWRNDMRRLLVATKGMVLTLASIEHVGGAVTRSRDFVTRAKLP